MTRDCLRLLALSALSLTLVGCSEKKFDEPMKLGGQLVSAETLNAGKENYTLYCRACHGDEGDGNGPASFGLRPPPRDFRQAQFKFGWVVDGMPHDDDFKRIVRDGLHGTAMLNWEIPDRELDPVIQYIKTFAPSDWADAEMGTQMVPPADPWGEARKTEAVDKGRTLYHGAAQCWTCHPAYESKATIAQIRNSTDLRPNLYFSELKESQYLKDGHKVKILPPDFTFSTMRSIRPGKERADLFSLIAAGIPGTAMPSWKGSLPDEDIWALAYYVESLGAMKDTPAAAQMRQALMDPAQNPDPAPPAPVEGAPAGSAPATPGATAPSTSGL